MSAGCAPPCRPRASRPPRRGGGPAKARAGSLAPGYARPPGPLSSRRADAAPRRRHRDLPPQACRCPRRPRRAYSPNGTKLAFTSDRDGDYDIYVKDLASAQVTQLTKDGEYSGVPDRRPSWSPDGTKIAFHREDDIWVMDANGSNQKNLIRTPDLVDGYPSWSPNGRKIAWARESIPDSPASRDIWKMDVSDGFNKTNITNNTHDESNPDWKPKRTP